MLLIDDYRPSVVSKEWFTVHSPNKKWKTYASRDRGLSDWSTFHEEYGVPSYEYIKRK